MVYQHRKKIPVHIIIPRVYNIKHVEVCLLSFYCTYYVKVGATNRPNDLDAAVMRRLKVKVSVGFPNENQRKSILETIMQNETNVIGKYNLDVVAQVTSDYSGNDLEELCRYVNLFRPTYIMVQRSQRCKIGSLLAATHI